MSILHELDQAFHARFQKFMRGEESTRPVNEEIERVYLQMDRHRPERCRHGKTALTCSECWFSGYEPGCNDRGNMI